MKTQQDILALLPGYHCGACGRKRCDEFANELADGNAKLSQCPILDQERFSDNKTKLTDMIGEVGGGHCSQTSVGLIDGYEADFELAPLPGESSCREVLYPFTNREFKAGEIIRYRPLGCPMIHFANVIDVSHGLITVHMIGPRNRMDDEDFCFEDVGVCMVGGFEGVVMGKLPSIGQTVRFLPHHCMMRKVHSGVVVALEGDKVIIEGIDLKVWAPPVKGEEYVKS